MRARLHRRVSQLEQYAFAISQDSRFHGQDVSGTSFVGSLLSPFAASKAEQFERSAERWDAAAHHVLEALLRVRRHQLVRAASAEVDVFGVGRSCGAARDAPGRATEVLAEPEESAAS